MYWHTKSTIAALSELGSAEHGLTTEQASASRALFGTNTLPEERSPGYLTLFLQQFRSPLIYILLGAAVLVFTLGHKSDATIIMVVLIINATIGTWQEGKAGNTLKALKKLNGSTATILRNHQEILISEAEIVRGDILILREGDKIPADARLLETENLEVDESALTGESDPVFKNEATLNQKDLQASDQKNMVFKSTFVISGQAKALATGIGIHTVIGAIASSIENMDTEMPLKKSIRRLSRSVIIAVFAISVAIFFIGMFYGNSAEDMLATVVAIAISAIPEGLPVVVTLILATGVWRMSKQNALIKRLQAVEALGQADVIAVDKTGTITKNQMMASMLYTNNKSFTIGGSGYSPEGELLFEEKIIEPRAHEELLLLAKIASLTSSATVAYSEASLDWQRISGDPTEAALLVFSQKVGFNREDLWHEYPLVSKTPFNSKIRYNASVHLVDGKQFLSVAGAPETILDRSETIWSDGAARSITEKDKGSIHLAMKAFSSRGLRVLALATNFDAPQGGTGLPALCFVGLVGISDSIRPEARDAILRAKDTGVRIIMITGDHRDTAEAIAREAGIFRDGDRVITGDELNNMTAQELSGALHTVTVFARVSPEHKMKIIEAYRHRGEVIAMTGDGVNDALSLASADLGVAMGKTGTEVAKESADIVLMDDNLGSIISAIEEGRNIYKSIRKVVSYLFSTGIGEILVVVAAILLAFPLPFAPSQIIWLNLVTDGFLVVALALEPKEKDILAGKLKQNKKILDSETLWRMILFAGVMTAGTVALFVVYLPEGALKASSVALTAAAVFQWFNAWNNRSDKKSIFSKGWMENKYLIGATALIVLLQIGALSIPFMQRILYTTPLSGREWALITAVAFSAVIAEEFRKYFFAGKKHHNKKNPSSTAEKPQAVFSQN